MPMSRYELRNEYSLADPELYRAADKDDPEALLEGVAMAGLVGVLRQLGDLAEFAAEIFHNLHEEVMATAARGHGLTIRVQQLETEIPSIERAFLSQTDHSSFFYHPGVDWHPNLRQDQNLVTQGDLPRFIMDSYEECRAPPRLFLLDKFDVAGAGACLKRYTDPSFFKVEASEMTTADIQREKRTRKPKKKGPRWRNGETPEVLPTSHAKLHQLFLEERVENGRSNHSRRVKLKRRLNGFPFDTKTGKSYMEKLLKSPSPDHKVLDKVAVNSLPLVSATNDLKESGFEIFEFRPVSPDRASGGRNRSPPSSPDGEETILNPSMYEPNEPPTDDKICEVPNLYPTVATHGISSTIDQVTGEKVVAEDAESNREGSFTGYQSDDVASEIDNYVDASSTMESEMDRDSELKVTSDITTSLTKSESLISDADEEHLCTKSSDSQSTGDSIISDDGNNSPAKEISSFSSDSPSTSAENPQAENISAKGFRYSDVPVNEIADVSSYQKTADEDFQVDYHSKPGVYDDPCIETDAFTSHRSGFEQLSSNLCSSGSIPNLVHSDSEEAVRKCTLKAPESDEMVCTLDDKENKTDLVIDPPCSPSLRGSELQSEDDSPRSSAGKHILDEHVPCSSTVSDVYSHAIDSSVKTSSNSKHESGSDGEDQNLVNDVASTLNMLDVLQTNGNSDLSPENLIPGKLEDELPNMPEISPSDYAVTAHNGDNIKSAISKEDNLIDVLDDGDSNDSTDSPNHFPSIMEASPGKKLEETSAVNAQSVNVEDNHSNSSTDNQISSENLKLSNLANASERPMEGLDAHKGVVIPEEETTANETLALGTPESCEEVGLRATGITHHVSLIDSEAQQSSSCTPEDLEERAGTADTVEIDGITLLSRFSGREITEISGSADVKSVNEVHVLFDRSDSEADKSSTTDMASAVSAVSENASLSKLVEEHNNCFDDTGMDKLENDENCPSECLEESDHVEKVSPPEASASGFESVFCNTVNNDHSKLEVSGTVPNSHLDLEVDHGLEFVHAATIGSSEEQCGVDRGHELFNQCDLGNHVPDVSSLPVDYDTEESVAQEKIGLPLSQLDQELLHPDEISSDLSPLLPINHQHMLDHDDCKRDDDAASSLPLEAYRSPPSFPELPRPSDHEIDVPGYPKDPLGSIFPPINPLSETNQINLADLPPMPPLPPVEWRMGKLQHASSSTQGEEMRHKELFPQLISPLTVPFDEVSSPPPTTSADDVGSSPRIAFTGNTNSSLEEMKHSPIEIAPETASKEENVENSCPSLEVNTMHETTDLPPEIENKQQQIVKPISESAPETALKEENVENSCSSLEVNTLHETTDLPPEIENKQEQIAKPISESAPETASREENVENSCSSLEVNTLHETTDLPPEIENKQLQIVKPISETAPETASKEENVENSCSSLEVHTLRQTTDLPPQIENKQQQIVKPVSDRALTSPAQEDGVENGSRTVKLPQPRNPLIDDVAILDKSKLRKVTERVRPEIQKVDERDSLLAQIRTKSFNLRPAMASRPSIRGPNTNLQVAAILEKANAIRQAFAGSDEDDSDSWSDS